MKSVDNRCATRTNKQSGNSEESRSLYDPKYWPFSNQLSDDTEVTTTAGFLRRLRERCMGAEQNEGYALADAQMYEQQANELRAEFAEAIKHGQVLSEEVDRLRAIIKKANEMGFEILEQIAANTSGGTEH